jgi:hypothetical protein
MKHRVVPNTVSKRFRRKLRRARAPYLLWLQCKRPHVYARLRRLWKARLLEMICSVSPIDTPLFSLAPIYTHIHWRTDAQAVGD